MQGGKRNETSKSMVFKKDDAQSRIYKSSAPVFIPAVTESHTGEPSVSQHYLALLQLHQLFGQHEQQRSRAANLTSILLCLPCHLEQQRHFPVVPATRCGQCCLNQPDKAERTSFLFRFLIFFFFFLGF